MITIKIIVKVGGVLCYNDTYSVRFFKNVLTLLSRSTLRKEAVRLSNSFAESGRSTHLYVVEGQNVMIYLTLTWRSWSEGRCLRYDAV